MRLIRLAYPGNILAVTLRTPYEGVTLSGRVVPELPGSALDTARYGASTRGAAAWRSVNRTLVRMPHVVKGKKALVLRVNPSS